MKMLSWLHAHIIDVTTIDSLLSQLHVLLILSVSQQLRQIKISHKERRENRIQLQLHSAKYIKCHLLLLITTFLNKNVPSCLYKSNLSDIYEENKHPLVSH